MTTPEEQAVYRVRRVYRKGDTPRKYQYTLELTDDRTREIMATCELIGRATFATVAMTDREQRSWQMKPNRKVMPSRWTVTDPEDHVAMQFDQKIMGKLANPLYRVALVLLDGEGEEAFRLVDTRTNIPDRILDLGPGEWAIIRGEKPAAKLVRLPRRKAQPTGLLSKVRSYLTASDQGIISAGANHLLAAPVALGMLMIFNELSDPSVA